MPKPCPLTDEQLATAHARVVAGELLSVVAQDLGMKASSLGYHIRGGKAARYLGRPWQKHINASHHAIATGNHAEAATELRHAAEILTTFAGSSV